MTLDDAVEAVRRTLPSDQLRVDRRLARQDGEAYLLVVLDVRRDLDDDGPVENGPRLVSKADGAVRRLTVPEALERATRTHRRARAEALAFARRTWAQWKAAEGAWRSREEGVLELSARLIERAYVAMIRTLSL